MARNPRKRNHPRLTREQARGFKLKNALLRRHQWPVMLREQLAEVSRILGEQQIPYWLDRGTLLGAHRNGKLIVNDGDIDLRMPLEHWRRAHDALRAGLSEAFEVTAHHHGKVIFGLEDDGPAWFESAEGARYVIAGLDDLADGESHSATAITVHETGKNWDREPNLDIYCYRINQFACCTPAHWERPWESDGKRYVCMPSDHPPSRIVPFEMIYPLGEIEFEGLTLPTPNQPVEYLTRILGYLGENAKYDIETGLFVKRE